MRRQTTALVALASTVAALAGCTTMKAPADMTFFVTSAGSGQGGDLGGLAGADALCTARAAAAGSTGRTWHAYLSTVPKPGVAGVDARDRIGTGPWRNAKGVVVAQSVADLHGDGNNINKQTALTEKGEVVNGRGDTPNLHDILTGSQPNGTAIKGTVDTTCGDWTRSSGGAAMLGHSDRTGLDDSAPAKSWNSAHQSRGCDMESLRATGGEGRLYCFATN